MNKTLFSYELPPDRAIRVVQGDLTQEAVDAIVNAANGGLQHGGGVAGAIVRRGGYAIQRESNAWVQTHGPIPTGTGAALTGAGNLPAHYVIHVVGPIWRQRGDEPQLLRQAVQSALAMADAHQLRSLSMPAISSGIFGFPKPLATEVIWQATLDYFHAHPQSHIREVRFCNIDSLTARLFVEAGQRLTTARPTPEATTPAEPAPPSPGG